MSSVNNINENVISDEAIKKVFTNNENWLTENITKVPAAQNLVDASGKSFDKQVDNSIKQIKKSKIHKMDLDQIKKNLGKKFKDSPD